MKKKKRAILITGFSNWGKTTIIYELFGRKWIGKQTPYKIKDSNLEKEFIVMPYSNDDITNPEKFINELRKRYNNRDNDIDLLSAFCPTSEDKNNSLKILRKGFFQQFDEIVLVYLIDRWDNHASLNMKKIIDFYKSLENLKHIEIIVENSKSEVEILTAKIEKIKNELENIYQQKEQ